MAGKEYERTKEQMARCVVRDVESQIRGHLEIGTLDPDFVAELYLRVLEELRSRPAAEEDLVSSLALTVYFVTASQQPGGRISPDFIPLRRVIARTLSEISSRGQEQGSEQDG